MPDAQPTFTWTAVPNAASYFVYAYDTTSPTQYGTNPPGGTTRYQLSLPGGHSFYCWMTTVDRAGVEGDPSSYMYFRSTTVTWTASGSPNANWTDAADWGEPPRCPLIYYCSAAQEALTRMIFLQIRSLTA